MTSPRTCCGAYPDEPHRAWCREPLKPTTSAEVLARRKKPTAEEQAERVRRIEQAKAGKPACTCTGVVAATGDRRRAPSMAPQCALTSLRTPSARHGARRRAAACSLIGRS